MDRNETGIIWARIKEVGLLFYLVDPRETIFEKPEEVPDYISQAVPYIVLGVILEQVLRWKQGKPLVRPDEGMISLAFTFLMEITLEIYRGMGYGMYFYVYEHWRLFDFEWDSPWTWIMTALVVDFRYYVLHRALHEVSLFWAIHQLHHISEGYNLTMAAQNSFLLPYLDSVSYIPIALLGVPPSHFLVHMQLNTLYQIWLHTETVSSLGPLEYIINTPSHHRVHHGSNRYCIDKNYAGALIIWDRIFGTFEPEGDQVVYGLTHPVSTYNPIKLQFHHFQSIWESLWKMESWGDRLKVLFYGPGWEPGQPRLYPKDLLPDNKTPMQKYQPKSPWHLQVHAVMLFLIGGMMHAQFVSIHKTWHLHQALLFLGYMVLSIQSLGLMLKNDTQGPRVELLRCLVSAFLVPIFPFMDVWPLKLFTWVSGFHAIIWALKNKQKQLR